jgi:CBS domain-containing protein
MLLKEIMTANVETIDPDDSLEQAARRMKECDVGSLPVWDGERAVGIITDRDIAVRSTASGQHPSRVRVGEVMSPDPVCCYEDQELPAAARLMEEHQIRRLPVLRRDGGLVGIVSLADLAVRNRDPNLPAAVLRRVSAPLEPEREHN